MKHRARPTPLVWATAAFLASAFWAAPATVYLFNAGEVVTPLADIIRFAWLPQLAVLALVVALGAFGGERLRRALAALLLAAAALLYLQGNVLLHDYGRLDGSEIDWARHRLAGALEAVLWIGTPVAVLALRRLVWRAAPVASAAILLLCALSIGGHLLQGRSFSHARASGLDAGFSTFSREANVLVIVLDAFASPLLETMLERDPGLAARLQGFTWYRDALAAYPTTLPSVPTILSGRTTDNGRPVKEFLSESLSRDSLPVRLQEHGFDTCTISEPMYGEFLAGVPFASSVSFLDARPRDHRHRDALLVWNVALFRYTPHYLKMRVYDRQRWLLRAPAEEAIAMPYATEAPWRKPSPGQMSGRILQQQLLREADASSRRPTFKFLHFFGTHMPYFLDAEGRQLTEAQYEAMTEAEAVGPQSACALDEVLEIVARLEVLGVLERTLVIVTGDHGSHLPLLGDVDRAAVVAGRPAPSRTLPVLLVRPMGARDPLRISDAPVSLADIAATVAQAAGLPGDFPGTPLHEVPERDSRTRAYRDYTWKHEYWWEEYLPEMTEYRVDGAVRDSTSWSAGILLRTGG